jgi:hypothetical protein
LGPVHLGDKIRALYPEVNKYNYGTGINNKLNNFPQPRRKTIHKEVDGHMAAGSETRTGPEKHNKYNTKKLNFFTPGYWTINKIPHNDRTESNNNEYRQGRTGYNKIKVEQFFNVFILHYSS